MPEIINVGDLVQQVRACCERHPSLGKIGTVSWIETRLVCCYYCGYNVANTKSDTLAGCNPNASGVPLSWLKRIPPIEELESTDERESINA